MEQEIKCMKYGCRRKPVLKEKGKEFNVYLCGCGTEFTIRKTKK